MLGSSVKYSSGLGLEVANLLLLRVFLVKPEQFGMMFSLLNHWGCWTYAAINSLTKEFKRHLFKDINEFKRHYSTRKLSSTLPSFLHVQRLYTVAMEL